jgi:phosphopantothenoylcysteine synthetase/decarboxylase
MSARKKTTDYRNTRIRNKQEQKRPTKTSLITIQKNTSTIALRNGSNNILLNTRKEITKTQKQKQIKFLKT